MYGPSNMFDELRSIRRARLQQKFMHYFFLSLGSYLLALATLCWVIAWATK